MECGSSALNSLRRRCVLGSLGAAAALLPGRSLAQAGGSPVVLGTPQASRSEVLRSEPLRFSGGLDGNDERYSFPAELLSLAMRSAGSHRELLQIGGMTQARLAVEVSEGRMDTLLLPSSWPINAAVTPVLVPLRRGLLGVRLLLARPEVAQKLARCKTLAELRSGFVMGYGADWIDRPAFEPLGFRMNAGASYSGLFDMLRAGRCDYLNRGVNEVWAELDHPQLGRGLVVVPGVGLSYPLDDYFWVRRGNTELHEQITRGLARAKADGSYRASFDRFHSAGLRRAALPSRVMFDVGGYPSEPGTPLELFDLLGELRRPPAPRRQPG
jgi:hypothetical protein